VAESARQAAQLGPIPTVAPPAFVASASHLSCVGRSEESCVKNRVRESRTLGSVRGGAGRLWSPLPGHEAGNGGYAPSGCPTVATSSLLLGDRKVAGSNPVAPSHFRRLHPSLEKYSGQRDVPLNQPAQKNGALKKFEEFREAGAFRRSSEFARLRWRSALPDPCPGSSWRCIALHGALSRDLLRSTSLAQEGFAFLPAFTV
jgi:hypothetical protein